MSISPTEPALELAQFVDDMIVQHNYPGFEARAFKIGLPEHIVQFPSKLFADALGHESIYVRIVALRWFQEKGLGQSSPLSKAISGLTVHEDPWVRFEAGQTLERFSHPTLAMAITVSALLKDKEPFVRRGAAKGLAKVLPRLKEARVKDEELTEVVAALKEALADRDGPTSETESGKGFAAWRDLRRLMTNAVHLSRLKTFGKRLIQLHLRRLPAQYLQLKLSDHRKISVGAMPCIARETHGVSPTREMSNGINTCCSAPSVLTVNGIGLPAGIDRPQFR